MFALQATSSFLNTSSEVLPLSLLPSEKPLNTPDWVGRERETEGSILMENFKKNTKEFMNSVAKSRKIERYDAPKSERRKKGSLGGETQNNIPRNKRRTSTSMFGAVPRKRRQVIEPSTESFVTKSSRDAELRMSEPSTSSSEENNTSHRRLLNYLIGIVAFANICNVLSFVWITYDCITTRRAKSRMRLHSRQIANENNIPLTEI